MAITKKAFSNYITAFQFRELFNDMGWNNDHARQQIVIDDNQTWQLTGIAEKSGFRIFTCTSAMGKPLPDAVTRRKIERKTTKLFQEHLIIFIDEQHQKQVWQLAVRQAGKPVKISETPYWLTHDPELLYQRAAGLFFTLDDEEKITIVDVTKRVAENFQKNNEKVTKRFYDGFKKQHAAFLNFIKGIEGDVNQKWYTSLMLNRLMFCYFIQKKGFLDNNRNYLRDKLTACRKMKGENQFYSFYRNFLLVLFHEGLGAPAHNEKIEVEIGKVPYLNGGLFDEHELEKSFRNIEIEDKAFEGLFDFFDDWEWHLDTRDNASGKEINPDVIGYIFEKYINDRAQMGAYYTKEDITDYIAKNCIIPWLFEEVKRHYPKAFTPDSWIWTMLRDNGDEYIYDAVKYGIPESKGLFDDLPPDIQKGFAPEIEKQIIGADGPYLYELRSAWNQRAPVEIALPTETYREVIERRKRYDEVKRKIEQGDIREINDFITYNLYIRQFAQDVIDSTPDADLIRYFYKAITKMTVLDPTCGSGAFLFAALNVLEPLYAACLGRMQNFVTDAPKGKFRFFEDVLKHVNTPEHPNLQYFIYKSIILNNLYGVDIMNEAVEIAKLRLFLKLVATVDANYRKPNLGLEPLPDVDFNIRVGNTLIGYATEAEIDDAFSEEFDYDNDAGRIKEECDIVARSFTRYKEMQLNGNSDFTDFKSAKDDLNERLVKLRGELDKLLYKKHYSNIKFNKWFETHQPFHWFAEFYEIVHGRSGFDVVIGNPPYVVYMESKISYRVNRDKFSTYTSKNLYAYVFERSINISNKSAIVGLIVQLSAITSTGMAPLQRLLINRGQIVSVSFPRRPESMFDGIEMPVVILISTPIQCSIKSSRIFRFYTEERTIAFNHLQIHEHNIHLGGHRIAKIDSEIGHSILYKLLSNTHTLGEYSTKTTKQIVYYQEACRYWMKACISIPYFTKNGLSIKPMHGRVIGFENMNSTAFAVGLLNSSLFYFVYSTISDCEHVNDSFVRWFPIFENWQSRDWVENISILSDDIKSNSTRKIISTKQGHRIEYDELDASKSKPIIDKIDTLLAQHYGFSQEELDYIINYDIKYRMGKELEETEG